jgi:peroxiredoxin Q/BCP
MTPAVNKALPEFEANATGGVKFTPQAFGPDRGAVLLPEGQHARLHHRSDAVPRPAQGLPPKAGAVVFGVSRDNMASHDKFKQNLELPFELIADTEEKLCHMFGVVKNKIMYGKKVKGIERSTFLIDAAGVLRAEWRGIKVAGHVDEVLKAVQGPEEGRLRSSANRFRGRAWCGCLPFPESRAARCAAFLLSNSPRLRCPMPCPSRRPEG